MSAVTHPGGLAARSGPTRGVGGSPRRTGLRSARHPVLPLAVARRVGGWLFPDGLSERRARRRAAALTALLVGIVVGVTWFEAGQFFANGDLGPFHRSGARSEFGSLWSHQGTGAGAPMYDMTRAVALALGTLAGWLGGGAPLAERLLFASMFAFAAGGSASFVGRFTARRWLIGLSGVLGAFNLLAIAGLPNYLPVVATGIGGLLAAFAVDAARDEGSPWLAATMATLPLAYLANNPPLLGVMAAVVASLPVVAAALTGTGRAGAWRVALWLGRTALAALPLALYWIVPQVLSIRNAVSGGTVTAQTDVTGWAWTHRNNSLANVLTMRSYWTWPEPVYHGTAGRVLGSRLVSPLAWVLPTALPIAALVAAPARRRMVCWTTLALVTIACLGKGLHGPLAGANLALYRNVPGFWLLREPMSKLGFVAVLGAVLLWAVALDGLASRRPDRHVAARAATWWGRGRTAGRALLVAGPLLLTWPMVTGAVTHDTKPGAAEQVEVPDGWHELAALVNGSPRWGKVLVLPLSDFYQMPTTWGFYGADNVANGLFARPVITRNVDGYIGDATAYRQLVEATQQAVLAGRADRTLALMQLLGADQVVVRTDFAPSSPLRRVDIVEADRLITALSSMPGVRTVGSTSVGAVFAPEAPAGLVQSGSELYGTTFEALTVGAQAAATPSGVVLTDEPDASVSGHLWAEEVGDASLISTPEGVLQVGRDQSGIGHYWATVEEGESGPRLVLRDAAPVSLGDEVISHRAELAGPFEGELLGLAIGEELVGFADGMVVDVPANSAVHPVVAASASIVGDLGPLSDCNRSDDRTMAEAGIDSAVLDEPGGPVLRLAAAAHRACRALPLDGAAAGSVVHVELTARSLSGAPPAACLWVDGPGTCVPLPAARDVDGWQVRAGFVTLPAGTTAARLFLYADGREGEPVTLTEYRWPLVRLAATDDTPLGAAATPTSSAHQVLAGNYELSAAVANTVSLTPWTPVGDCHRSDDRSLDEVGISLRALDGDAPAGTGAGLELSARAHSACTSADVVGLVPGAAYELRLEHRTAKGRSPRVCVYDRLARRCLTLTVDGRAASALPTAPDWQQAALSFTAPSGGADSVQLFLYADGTPDGTVVAYRSVEVVPRSRDVITLHTSPTGGPPPSIEWERHSSSRYTVRVQGATAPFVLTLAESYSDGWRLSGPGIETLRPIEVNGYANGWLVPAPVDGELTLRYAPDLWARRAIVISLGAAVIVAFLAAVKLVRAGSAELPPIPESRP